MTDWQTDKLTDICIPRAAFAAENEIQYNSASHWMCLNPDYFISL